MKQILLILLDNALKHSDGAIHLTAETKDSRVLVSVQNFGEGISGEQLEHVFDRFYRGDDSSHNQGLGLGLPIAKELVEAQGGKISMQSELGKGSILLLSFPEGVTGSDWCEDDPNFRCLQGLRPCKHLKFGNLSPHDLNNYLEGNFSISRGVGCFLRASPAKNTQLPPFIEKIPLKVNKCLQKIKEGLIDWKSFGGHNYLHI